LPISPERHITLLTGATGFLGKVILQLSPIGPVITLGRNAEVDITCDLQFYTPTLKDQIDVVIHAAGKAHSIPKTKTEEEAFYQVNHQGTLHLLQGLEKLDQPPKQFIFISTVAVYGREEGENIDENHPLNGNSPYAKSKILAEAAIQDWCQNHSVNLVILRLPLIIGPNPPGNLGKIITAIQSGRYFKIKKNPARKSLVLAKDIAKLIPELRGKSGVFNLTDGHHPYFNEIEDAIAEGLSKTIQMEVPLGAVRWLARGGDIAQQLSIPFPLTSSRLLKMTQTLTFSDKKARKELNWIPNAAISCLQEGNFALDNENEFHAS